MNEILNAEAKLKEAVLATHPSQYGETEVLEMKIYLLPEAIQIQIACETIEPRSEGEFTWSDRWVVRARKDQTFSESLGIATSTREEEGRTDEIGHRSKRAE